MRAELQAVLGAHGGRWMDQLENSHYHNGNINNNGLQAVLGAAKTQPLSVGRV